MSPHSMCTKWQVTVTISLTVKSRESPKEHHLPGTPVCVLMDAYPVLGFCGYCVRASTGHCSARTHLPHSLPRPFLPWPLPEGCHVGSVGYSQDGGGGHGGLLVTAGTTGTGPRAVTLLTPAATATTPSAQFPRVKVSVPSDTWGADRAENSDGKVTR